MSSLAVVVGVVVNKKGEILLAQRAGHQHLAGLWEFPGGKLEPSELPLVGLWRELKEELGIDLISAEPLIQIHHQYPDKSVLLDVYTVTQFDGEPFGREGQPLAWVNKTQLAQFPLPEANLPIVKALQLPSVISISGAAANADDWLQQFAQHAHSSNHILIRPFDQIQNAWMWQPIIQKACEIAQAHNAKILIHGSLVVKLGGSNISVYLNQLPDVCMGVHLPSDLAKKWIYRLPERMFLGVSCHSCEDLMQLNTAVDYVLISPVLKTHSHPDAIGLGWSGFADFCRAAKLPVFALGGMQRTHLNLIKQLGGQGVAGIRGFWP